MGRSVPFCAHMRYACGSGGQEVYDMMKMLTKMIKVAGTEVKMVSHDGGASWHTCRISVPTTEVAPKLSPLLSNPLNPIPGQRTKYYGNQAVLCYPVLGSQIKKVFPRQAAGISLRKEALDLERSNHIRQTASLFKVPERVSDRKRRSY